MRFDVYGRFQVEVVREQHNWIVYRLEPGKRIRDNDLVIPSSCATEELATILDDLLHELSRPGERVRVLP